MEENYQDTYKEHEIEIEPVQLPETGRWTADVDIVRVGLTTQGVKKTDLEDFDTEEEALNYAKGFARNLVDKLLLPSYEDSERQREAIGRQAQKLGSAQDLEIGIDGWNRENGDPSDPEYTGPEGQVWILTLANRKTLKFARIGFTDIQVALCHSECKDVVEKRIQEGLTMIPKKKNE
jgi:hypothetical protein